MVTLVNCFEIPAGRDDELFSLWQQVAHDEGFRALVGQPALAAFRSLPALYEVVLKRKAEPPPSPITQSRHSSGDSSSPQSETFTMWSDTLAAEVRDPKGLGAQLASRLS
jgi:hypothetical protein